MQRLLVSVALALSPLLAAYAAAPSTGVYEVEVLVFESRLPDLEAGELWTFSKKTATPVDAVAPPALNGGNSELSTVAATLQNDPRYRVIAHQRWVQPAEARTATKPVVVRSSDNEVDGTLLFYMNRFLHVELALGFQPPKTLGSSPATEPNGALYRINEQRRIKSQDINYFDHPKFGALVRVAPAGPGAIAGTP